MGTLTSTAHERLVPTVGRRRRDEGSAERPGDLSLALGVAACVCALVPVIGEVVTVPLAVLAVTLGIVGVRRYESGRTPRVGAAAAGAALGAVAVAVTLVVLTATYASP